MAMRLLLAAATVASLAFGTSTAVAADTDIVISGGPHDAERGPDGTTTLSLTAINLTARAVVLRLVPAAPGCGKAVGDPIVQPQTSSAITFTTTCDSGEQPRTGTVQVTYVYGGGKPVTSKLPIQFTVMQRSAAQWSVLWWFGLGIPLALLLVLVPYGYWVAHPQGNPRGERSALGSPFREFLWHAWAKAKQRLPGIDKDWSLSDSWSSNVTLGAGLFTAVLASTGPASAILGDDAIGPLAVVTVAAALSAALVATGPLWLVIWKRRWEDDPAAQLNTVAGVLVATFVVLSASLGLVITLAMLVDLTPVYVLAVAAIGLLGTYSAKSIPMTLALGVQGAQDGAVAPSGTAKPSAMP